MKKYEFILLADLLVRDRKDVRQQQGYKEALETRHHESDVTILQIFYVMEGWALRHGTPRMKVYVKDGWLILEKPGIATYKFIDSEEGIKEIAEFLVLRGEAGRHEVTFYASAK